jgi:hypothetical protein
MRPQGSPAELERRRLRAIELLQRDMSWPNGSASIAGQSVVAAPEAVAAAGTVAAPAVIPRAVPTARARVPALVVPVTEEAPVGRA